MIKFLENAYHMLRRLTTLILDRIHLGEDFL